MEGPDGKLGSKKTYLMNTHSIKAVFLYMVKSIFKSTYLHVSPMSTTPSITIFYTILLLSSVKQDAVLLQISNTHFVAETEVSQSLAFLFENAYSMV